MFRWSCAHCAYLHPVTTTVENAVKHGITRQRTGGDVNIRAELQHGRTLSVVIDDTGLGRATRNWHGEERWVLAFPMSSGVCVGIMVIRHRLQSPVHRATGLRLKSGYHLHRQVRLQMPLSRVIDFGLK